MSITIGLRKSIFCLLGQVLAGGGSWTLGPQSRGHGKEQKILKCIYFLFHFSVLKRKCYLCITMPFCWGWGWSGVSQFSLSVVSTLYDPLNCSTPGLPVHHQLPEFTQTHVHWVGDAIQPSRLLSPPLLLPPSIFPSIRVFSSKSVLRIRWPEHEKAEREGQVLLNPAPAWPLSAHAPRRHTGTLKRSKYWSRGERKAPEWIGIFPGAMFFRRWSGDLI